MSISFSPCKMDYSSWLTISGFIMAVLLFFLNESLHNSNDRDEMDYYYYSILRFSVTGLIVITIGGILCFIYNVESVGAKLVTIVLFVLPVFSIALIIYRQKNAKRSRRNYFEENAIKQILPEYQPDIDLD